MISIDPREVRHHLALALGRRAGIGAIVLALAAMASWAGVVVSERRHGGNASGGPRVEIYPTGDRLPANLLRMYLVFDTTMSMGESNTHLRLLDDAGQPVDKAFLQLDEELWDPTGRRLTVLFDPGRVKRGLRANLESGAPLVEGRRYRLAVDAGWRDADGRPLGATTSKLFEVSAPDRTSPVVNEWTLEAPAAGTSDALVLRFPEILDRALLSSAITIVDEAGAAIDGTIGVAAGEQVWTFTPTRVWRAGQYALRVSPDLEDVAGNSLRRVFDADMPQHAGGDHPIPGAVIRSFYISDQTDR